MSHGGVGFFLMDIGDSAPLHEVELMSGFDDLEFHDDSFLPGGSMVQESSPQVAAQYEIFSADGDEPALQAEQDYFVQASSSSLNQTAVDSVTWNGMIASAYGQYKALDETLKFPWEVGACAGVFRNDPPVSFPSIQPFVESIPPQHVDKPGVQGDRVSFSLQVGACYTHAISDMRDLDYFEEKLEQLELACGKWMDILSTHWEASTVGKQICQDLRSDPSGGEAVETLKACFGTKSPSTLLKRAATLRKYLVWHYNEFNSRGVYVHAFPLVESDVWNFFKWLRVERQQKSRGFTTTSTFLETVRFCKFTVGLQGCDEVLGWDLLQWNGERKVLHPRPRFLNLFI